MLHTVKLLEFTTVGKKVPKSHMVYPIVCLPEEYSDLIGERVSIYGTDHLGQRAFLIVPENGVAQPGNVSTQICSEERLQALELRIKNLEGRVENQMRDKQRYAGSAVPQWAWPDSNRRSSPCKGDVMTS